MRTKYRAESARFSLPDLGAELSLEKRPTTKSGAQTWPQVVMPSRRDLFYDGGWQQARSGRTIEIYSPGTQESLGHIADAGAEDVDAAVRAAHRAFPAWRKLPPLERVARVKQVAQLLRQRASELGMLDAVDSGNSVRSMTNDVMRMANVADYFAGLLTEVKGEAS